MKKWVILWVLTIVIIQHSINADIMAELAKMDRDNRIRLNEYSSNVLFAENGYLRVAYFDDGSDVPSIVAYKINEDNIKLIVRIKTWDFAFRIDDYYYQRDGIDHFTIDVHNYYLVELVYVNDRLETYCNRVRDINTNGFMFNDAEINDNITKVPRYYRPTYPCLEKDLEKGIKVKIASLTNERTNEMVDSYESETYDYYYHIVVDGQQVRINGYLLDFGDKIDYRTPLLILKR